MWLLVSGALGNPCQTQLDTWADFKPGTSSHSWQQSGGWPRDRLSELPPFRVAQIELYKNAFKRYPSGVQNALMAGDLPDVPGMDEVAATLALGRPDWSWKVGDGCRQLLYGADTGKGLLLESCSGELVAQRELKAPISCERLDVLVPRLEKRSGGFSDFDFGQQVAILAGLPDRWMTEESLELAFGPSTTKGNPLSFLDDKGTAVDVTVQLDPTGYALAWSRESGADFVGGLAEDAPTPSGSGGTGGSDGEGVPRAPGPVLPAVSLGDGKRVFEFSCGSSPIHASLSFAGPTYRAVARMGTPEDLRLYITSGEVRQGTKKLIFEGLGAGTRSDDGVALSLARWPEASCRGVTVSVPPG